jgi:putative NADH-flavin reductase
VLGLRVLVVEADGPLGRRVVNEALLRGHTVLATVLDPEARFSPTVRVLTDPGDAGDLDAVVTSGDAPEVPAARALVVGGMPDEGVTAVLPAAEPVPGSRTGRYSHERREGELSLEDLAVAICDELDRRAFEDDVLVVGPA